MSLGTLVDLYVSSSVGSVTEAWQSGVEAGLDGLVYVVTDPADVPEVQEAASQLEQEGGTRIVAGLTLRTEEGLRLLAIAPQEPQGDAPTSGASANEVASQVASWGGIILPVCPRHDDEGYPLKELPDADVKAAGWLVLTPRGSILGRDLALENCVGHGHIVLGATGPFGNLEDIGRIATWLTADRDHPNTWLGALSLGEAVAIERQRRDEQKLETLQNTGEGPKRKRRRKRRRKRPDGDSDSKGEPSGNSDSETS